MPFSFQPLSDSTTDISHVLVDQHIVGIVWRANGTWHAHEHKMSEPEIAAATREAAAEMLLQDR